MTREKNKVFIVSLPRTGTTSACLYFLQQGYKVAHTAFNSEVFNRADLVADTPVFIDYEKLHRDFPKARFIYLTRPTADWCVSIRQLLRSMRKKLQREEHAFDQEILRCFSLAFPNYEAMTGYSDSYLCHCLSRHKKGVLDYFGDDNKRFLIADITDKNCTQLFKLFLPDMKWEEGAVLPHVNRGRRISYWGSVNHPNKIPSF